MNINSTTQRIGLVTAGAALLLTVIWYFALWSPQGHALTKARARHATANAKITQLDSQISGLQALVKNIPADKQKLATYTAAVPDNPQLASALDQIQAAAAAANVRLSSVSPGGVAAGKSASSQQGLNGVPAITVSMAVTGTYPAVMSFITSLNSMPRTLVVTSLNLSSTGSGATSGISASISSDIFYAGQPTP